MQTEVIDGSGDRAFVTQAITSAFFLSRLSPHWQKEGLLKAQWANIVAGWCIKHYQKYAEAPGKSIETIFANWAKKNSEEAVKRQVSRFLSSLSEEYDQQGVKDSKVALDEAERHLNEAALDRLREKLASCLRKGETAGALEAQQNFKKIDLSVPPALDVLRDEGLQRKALDDRQNVLIRYPGVAGEFFGDELAEDSFVAFLAPIKSFKSQMALDIAWRAMRQHRNVAYFQIGDLSTNQVMRRFHKRAAYRPIKACSFDYPLGIIAPAKADGMPVIDTENRVFDTSITWKEAAKAFARVASKTKGGLWLSRHPTMSISITGIKGILEDWDQQGIVCPVVVIDYMENLAPSRGKKNPLDEIEETWALGRQLSEVRKCLVVTFSQSNKEGYKTWVLTRSNFSGNKLKLAHVTSFIGINCTDEERAMNAMRLNFVVRREEKYTETKCLYCAQCLDVSSPIVVSAL